MRRTRPLLLDAPEPFAPRTKSEDGEREEQDVAALRANDPAARQRLNSPGRGVDVFVALIIRGRQENGPAHRREVAALADRTNGDAATAKDVRELTRVEGH